MTIEFHCPYCTATVRVGDDASGKIGRCPKCETRLTVPSIPTQPKQQQNAETTETADVIPSQPGRSREPAGSKGVPALSNRSAVDEIGKLPIIPVDEDPVTSKYLKRRKKNPTNYLALVPPIFFGGLLALAGYLYYVYSLPSFEGTLEGSQENSHQSIQVELIGASFKIDEKIFSQIVDELREHPSDVRSQLVNLSFRAGANGIVILLRPGSKSDLVKVPVMQLKPISNYYDEHFNELNDARLDEMQAGLISLSQEWVNAPEGEKNETLPNYRNRVVYNAFVKGLGRICYANVEGAEYPCVHEDGEGALYFLVPTDTKTFSIRERSELDETPFFPSKFLIQVNVARPSMANAELVPIESEPMPDEETDSDNKDAADTEQDKKSEPEMSKQ